MGAHCAPQACRPRRGGPLAGAPSRPPRARVGRRYLGGRAGGRPRSPRPRARPHAPRPARPALRRFGARVCWPRAQCCSHLPPRPRPAARRRGLGSNAEARTPAGGAFAPTPSGDCSEQASRRPARCICAHRQALRAPRSGRRLDPRRPRGSRCRSRAPASLPVSVCPGPPSLPRARALGWETRGEGAPRPWPSQLVSGGPAGNKTSGGVRWCDPVAERHHLCPRLFRVGLPGHTAPLARLAEPFWAVHFSI